MILAVMLMMIIAICGFSAGHELGFYRISATYEAVVQYAVMLEEENHRLYQK